MFVHKCIIQGLGPAAVQYRLGAAGLSEKLDGFRALAYIENGEGHLVSRNHSDTLGAPRA
jgi:ATP-dependent DNA ligase